MRTVDGKDLELFSGDAPYPAGRVSRLAIGRHDVGILKCSQSRFAFRKFTDFPKMNPGKVTVGPTASDRGQKISHNRNCQNARSKTIEQDPKLHEEPAQTHA